MCRKNIVNEEQVPAEEYHAARELASAVDSQLQEYTEHAWRITPNGNLKAFGKEAENWGVMELGEQSLKEKILMFVVSF